MPTPTATPPATPSAEPTTLGCVAGVLAAPTYRPVPFSSAHPFVGWRSLALHGFSLEYPIGWHGTIEQDYEHPMGDFVSFGPKHEYGRPMNGVSVSVLQGADARQARAVRPEAEAWMSKVHREKVATPVGTATHLTGMEPGMGGDYPVDAYYLFVPAAAGRLDMWFYVAPMISSTTDEARHLVEHLRPATASATASPASIDPAGVRWVNDGLGIEHPFGWTLAQGLNFGGDPSTDTETFAIDPDPIRLGAGASKAAIVIAEIGRDGSPTSAGVALATERGQAAASGQCTEDATRTSTRTVYRLYVDREGALVGPGHVEYLVLLRVKDLDGNPVQSMYRIGSDTAAPEEFLRHIAFTMTARDLQTRWQ